MQCRCGGGWRGRRRREMGEELGRRGGVWGPLFASSSCAPSPSRAPVATAELPQGAGSHGGAPRAGGGGTQCGAAAGRAGSPSCPCRPFPRQGIPTKTVARRHCQLAAFLLHMARCSTRPRRKESYNKSLGGGLCKILFFVPSPAVVLHGRLFAYASLGHDPVWLQSRKRSGGGIPQRPLISVRDARSWWLRRRQCCREGRTTTDGGWGLRGKTCGNSPTRRGPKRLPHWASGRRGHP